MGREVRNINYTDLTYLAASREIRRLEKEGFHLALTRAEKDGSITVVMGRVVPVSEGK